MNNDFELQMKKRRAFLISRVNEIWKLEKAKGSSKNESTKGKQLKLWQEVKAFLEIA